MEPGRKRTVLITVATAGTVVLLLSMLGRPRQVDRGERDQQTVTLTLDDEAMLALIRDSVLQIIVPEGARLGPGDVLRIQFEEDDDGLRPAG
jgi:hypothetical protein